MQQKKESPVLFEHKGKCVCIYRFEFLTKEKCAYKNALSGFYFSLFLFLLREKNYNNGIKGKYYVLSCVNQRSIWIISFCTIFDI